VNYNGKLPISSYYAIREILELARRNNQYNPTSFIYPINQKKSVDENTKALIFIDDDLSGDIQRLKHEYSYDDGGYSKDNFRISCNDIIENLAIDHINPDNVIIFDCDPVIRDNILSERINFGIVFRDVILPLPYSLK